MRSGVVFGAWSMTLTAALSLPAASQAAFELYSRDFEADTPGAGNPPGIFSFAGNIPPLVFSTEVTDTDGVGGSNSYKHTADSTLNAQQFFFFAGMGQFAVFADDMNPLPGGPLSNDPASYTLEFDIKVMGHTSTTPVEVNFQAIDNDYDTVTGIDGNNNSQIDGAAVWVARMSPTIPLGNNDWQHVSFRLDEGAIVTDQNVPAAFFNNELSLQWIVAYNNGGFGFDANNMVSIDNVRITTAVPEPSTLVLLALCGLGSFTCRRPLR